MTRGTLVSKIEALAESAQQLYRGARQCGPEFDEIVTLTQGLCRSLRNLKTEAVENDSGFDRRDPNSTTAYREQLGPIIEDCEATLGQLQSLLDKHENGRPMTRNERAMLGLIKGQVDEGARDINHILDKVQLRSPTSTRAVVEGNGANLDRIKDKVDAIASRLFRRKDSGFSENEEDLWLRFRDELEREGFAADVLQRNEQVLRAYMREVESTHLSNGGDVPSVRGLLQQQRLNHPLSQPLSVSPGRYPLQLDTSPKENLYPQFENEKFAPSVKLGRPAPLEDHPRPVLALQAFGPNTPRHQHSDDETSSTSSTPSREMISTRDLIDMDRPIELNGMYLPPQFANYSVSPHARLALDAPPTQNALPAPGLDSADSSAPSMLPRTVSSMAPPPYNSGEQRLNPDQNGQEIPMDATWTKIRRSLISTEVLERAGVRYEARPEYVAILGHLSHAQVQEYARQSAEVWRKRNLNFRANPKHYTPYPDTDGSSWDESDTTDDEHRHSRDVKRTSFDEKRASLDEEKGTKSYPVIVSPPDENEKGPTSPSSTVKPKPILKNKNEHKVHFGPDPWEESKSSPRSYRDERDSDRDRKDKRHERRREYERARDRDRDRDRDHKDRERDRDRDRDRERDKDRDRDRGERDHRDGYRRRRRDEDRDRDHKSHRDRERERDRDRDRDERQSSRRKKRNDTLYAAGLGGAAASLVSVLAEAAAETLAAV